jgi:hypothetical protein
MVAGQKEGDNCVMKLLGNKKAYWSGRRMHKEKLGRLLD